MSFFRCSGIKAQLSRGEAVLLVPRSDQSDRLLQIFAVLGLGQDRVTIARSETLEQKVSRVASD